MRTKWSLAVLVCITTMFCGLAAGQSNWRKSLETSNLTLMMQPESEDSTNFTIWRWPYPGSDVDSLVPRENRKRWFGFEWKGAWSMAVEGSCLVGRDGTRVAIGQFDEVRGIPVAVFAVAAKGYKTNWSDCRPSPVVSAGVSTAAGLKMGLTEEEVIKLFGKPMSKSGSTLVWRWPWPCTELDYNGDTYQVKTGRLSVGIEGGRVVFFEVSGTDDGSP
jgi:hypothetical protein